MKRFLKAVFCSHTSFTQECSLEPEEQNYQWPPPEHHFCSFLRTSVDKSLAWAHFWSEMTKPNELLWAMTTRENIATVALFNTPNNLWNKFSYHLTSWGSFSDLDWTPMCSEAGDSELGAYSSSQKLRTQLSPDHTRCDNTAWPWLLLCIMRGRRMFSQLVQDVWELLASRRAVSGSHQGNCRWIIHFRGSGYLSCRRMNSWEGKGTGEHSHHGWEVLLWDSLQ